MNVKNLKAQQSEATRGALLATARRLFAKRGYAGTATEEIVREAGVTRGALYHQFGDKKGLFRAVFEAVECELAERLAAVAATTDPLEGLRSGCLAFLDACREPEVRQIAMLDAPSVLGWQEWREVDGRYGLGLLRAALAAAMDAGAIERQPVEPLAHLLLGAISEAALVVAHAADVGQARAEVGASCERLLGRLATR